MCAVIPTLFWIFLPSTNGLLQMSFPQLRCCCQTQAKTELSSPSTAPVSSGPRRSRVLLLTSMYTLPSGCVWHCDAACQMNILMLMPGDVYVRTKQEALPKQSLTIIEFLQYGCVCVCTYAIKMYSEFHKKTAGADACWSCVVTWCRHDSIL